jgi:hypothetical protein
MNGKENEDFLDYSNYNALKSIVLKKGLRAFKFYKKITEKTSQGSVGILKCMLKTDIFSDEMTDDNLSARDYLIEVSDTLCKDNLIIYKIGTETPFLCRHEYDVSLSLYKLSTYLPNFMRPYDLIKNAKADPRQRNPFVIYQSSFSKSLDVKRVRPPTFSDMALFEYIDSKITLEQLITNNVKSLKPEDIIKSSKIINSLLNQLMIAILIAQQKLLFIHNDLHYGNVLVCKCIQNTYALYIFDIKQNNLENDFDDVSDNVVCYALLPTFGYYPVIIDYGFSFTKDLLGGPLLTGIHHNNKGYMNHQYDELTDFKTLLVRLADSKYQFGIEDEKDKFQNLIKNELLKKLPIDKETGWDRNEDISISKQLVRYIRPFIEEYLKNVKSESFFQKYDYELIDMIGSLIILPLRSKNSDNLVDSLNKFFKEWLKIERWIGTSHMKIFVFKSIVDKIRADLLQNSDLTNIDTDSFQKTIYKIMNEIGNNIILSKLNYDEFYKSIINLSECFESIMFKANEKCIRRKKKEYSKINMKTSLDMYQKLVEPFISVDYKIQYGDYFVVFNAITETTSSFVIKDEKTIKIVNEMNRTDRAEYLYKSMTI